MFLSLFRYVSHHDRNDLFPHSFCINLMMFSVFTGYNIGCNLKMTSNDTLMNVSLEICVEKTSTIGVVGPMLCALIMVH